MFKVKNVFLTLGIGLQTLTGNAPMASRFQCCLLVWPGYLS
jgi:hypothetical protein